MNMLTRFNDQRAYIQDKLNISTPITVSHLERINSEISWPRVHKLEVAIQQEYEALKLTPDSERIQARIKELQAEIDKELEGVTQVLADMKREQVHSEMQQHKARELLQDAKQKIRTLADELGAQSNSVNSLDLANLSNAVRALSK